MNTAAKGNYAQVNGINLYFETHGAGRPLILLHGGLGSGEMFGPILPALGERHQVIACFFQDALVFLDSSRPLLLLDAPLRLGQAACRGRRFTG